MANSPRLTLFQRFYRWANNFIMTRLAPIERPGALLGGLFRLGARTYPYVLGRIASQHILVITTTGRRSGLPRQTALEYARDSASDGYIVMAGWKGRSDWVRNLRANPRVRVQVGQRSFDCTAQRLPDEAVACLLGEAAALNPGALQIFARWVGHPLDGSPSSLLEAARTVPSFLLIP